MFSTEDKKNRQAQYGIQVGKQYHLYYTFVYECFNIIKDISLDITEISTAWRAAALKEFIPSNPVTSQNQKDAAAPYIGYFYLFYLDLSNFFLIICIHQLAAHFAYSPFLSARRKICNKRENIMFRCLGQKYLHK